MSHFRVYVVTKTNNEDDLEKALMPFHEFECTGIVNEYVKHVDYTDDAVESWNKDKADYKDIYEFFDDYYNCKKLFKQSINVASFENLQERYAIISDDEQKIIKYYDFTNSNAKWDYWNIECDIKTEDEYVSCIKASDFNINIWKNKLIADVVKEYKLVKPLIKEPFITWNEVKNIYKDDISIAGEQYYELNRLTMESLQANNIFYYNTDIDEIATKTEQEYIDWCLNEHAPFWAIIDADGNWIEKGHMGWWAISWDHDKQWHDTWMKTINNIPDDCYIWSVDCHI